VRKSSTRERDDALRRLRRTTSVSLAVAGALVAAFAGLAARALPGHHTVKATNAAARQTTRSKRATPPPLVPAGSASTPAAPAAPPVQSQSPPVVVSGGT
jgi:hypothetical protein